MTLAEYVDEIKFILGGIGDSAVDIEIDGEIHRCVNRAFREIKRYVTTPAYMTVPFGASKTGTGATVDLSNTNVYKVIAVMRPDSYQSISLNTLDVFGLNQIYNAITNTEAYANRMLLLQQMNTISTDLEFLWDQHNKKLSVVMNPPFTSYITIEYVPDYKDVEEVTEPFWEDFILKLATGYAKIATGRIRSKYSLNNAQYSLDGETLVNEGNAEVKEIVDYLRANCDLSFTLN